MREFSALLRKEWRVELRQKHALAGVLLFVLATVFVCYLSLEKVDSSKTWGALLWITGVFAAFNAMQKTFQQEGSGTQLYLYTLAHPRNVILSKSLYNAIFVALLNSVSLFFFSLFFGTEVLEKADMPQFFCGLLLGSTGLGIALTFVSGLAYKTGTGTGLVAILGFPIIIPLLITIVRFSTNALDGLSWDENGFQLFILLLLNITSLLLSTLLFPYLWRE